MKPKLKIRRVKNLHDARYCSAVGISLISFQLEPGNSETVSPKDAAVIISWLSGPAYIGEFGYQTPDEINSVVAQVPLAYAEVPLDYRPELAARVDLPLIFRPEDPRLEPEDLFAEIQSLSERFPDALFELDLNIFPEASTLLEEYLGLMPRLLIEYPEPDLIYSDLQKEGDKPFGYILGHFVQEEKGELDYEKCDTFLERYDSFAVVG